MGAGRGRDGVELVLAGYVVGAGVGADRREEEERGRGMTASAPVAGAWASG